MWTCKICLERNADQGTHCKRCGTARSGKASESETTQFNPSGWELLVAAALLGLGVGVWVGAPHGLTLGLGVAVLFALLGCLA